MVFPNVVLHLTSFFVSLFSYVKDELIPPAFLIGEFDQVAASVLELPYTGERVSMFLFLPVQEGPQGFANMVSKLSGNNLRAATHKKNLRKQDVDLKLPKFRMELKLADEMIPVSAALVKIMKLPLQCLQFVFIFSNKEQVI